MGARRAGGGRRRFGPPDVNRSSRLEIEASERALDAAVDERPRAHVLGLLLAPHHLGIGIPRKLRAQAAEGEGIELLDTQNRDVVELAFAALGQKIEIDLARAQDDAADLGWLGELVGLRQDAAERGTRTEVGQG